MSNSGPFGFDPDDLERVAREAGQEIRDAFTKVGRFFDESTHATPWGVPFRTPRTERSREETTGETGDGVWAVYTVSGDGTATVDQVFATELDALRANQSNVDPSRRVRFLPYGVTVSVLDRDPSHAEQAAPKPQAAESPADESAADQPGPDAPGSTPAD